MSLALLSQSGCKEQAPPPPPPPGVEVITVGEQIVEVPHEWVASLDADNNSILRAQVSGTIFQVSYKEGQYVEAGTVLFQIDPRPFEAALAQARAARAEAEARLNKTQADVKRFTPLASTGAISQQELDDATQAALAAAAALEGAKASEDKAQLNLDYTRVTAPEGGIASISSVSVGDLVSPSSDPLATVVRVDPIRVNFRVSEQEYLRSMRRHPERNSADDVKLHLILADGSVFAEEGRVITIDSRVDPTTGTLRIVGSFPNPGSLLRPGQFGRVRILKPTDAPVVLVPQRALLDVQGRKIAAVVNADDTVSLRPVKVGARLDANFVVQEGLKAGERIVTEGLLKVRDGVKVTILPTPAASTPAAPAGKAS